MQDPARDAGTDSPRAPDGTIVQGADPGTSCVPAAPAGWQGPLVIYEGIGVKPPDCLLGFDLADDGKGDPTGEAATCGCTCGEASGMTCAPPVINFFSDAACSAGKSCGMKDQPTSTTCAAFDLTGCNGPHFALSDAKATGGACSPMPTKNVPAMVFKSVRVCAPKRADPSGCPNGSVITPTTGLPFEPETYCIARSGPRDCAFVSFPARRVYYKTLNDMRDCSPCTCDAPAGASCSGGSVQFHDDAACTTGTAPFGPPPLACTNGPKLHGVYKPGTASGGSCTAHPSQPVGSVDAQNATTLCCTQ
jgi:hypothetical protein